MINVFRYYSWVAIVLLFLSCSSNRELAKKEVPQKSHKFAFDFMEASSLSPILDQAAKENKLVFVDIYTSWCLPCKLMDEDVFTNEETAAIINKNFISYKVDAEKNNGPDLNFIYNVESYPTLLFLDTKGRVLARGKGTHYHSALISLANEALNKFSSEL